MSTDNATGTGTESVVVDVTTAEPKDTGVAFEEGPHLQDPEIRALKRKQMKAAGFTLSTPGITDDMKAILREKG